MMDFANSVAGGFRINNAAWRKLFAVAELHGWEPMGTARPRHSEDGDPDDWPSCYFSNAGQVMIAEDALALAQALERALPNIPVEDKLAGVTNPKYGGIPDTVAVYIPVEHWLSGDNREIVRKAAEFFRAGECTIY